MKKYTHINQDMRRKIDELFNVRRMSISQIAKELGVSKNTISYEIKQNSSRAKACNKPYCKHCIKKYCDKKGLKVIDDFYFYRFSEAQQTAEERQKNSHNYSKIDNNPRLKGVIINWLVYLGYKPDVIAGRLRLKYPNDPSMHISCETIYNWIYKGNGEKYKKYLAKGNRKHKEKRGWNKPSKSNIPERVSVHKRDKVIDERKRIGDLEADTIVSPNHSSGVCVTTLDCRKSRKMFAQITKHHRADDVTFSLDEILCKLSAGIVKSVTFDNGTEFYRHYVIRDKHGVQTFFADPYSSWQRGTNERCNGLIRRYFPKGTDFKNITQEELDEVIDYWNNMPRKILGYKTPNEVWDEEVEKEKGLRESRAL